MIRESNVTAPTAQFTLLQARNWLRRNLRDGAKCPCCSQWAQIYRRTINSGMAHSLIVMYQESETDWCHVPTVVGGRSREEAKLRYWGLVEEMVEPREDGGRAGYWRVTTRGVNFIHGGHVPKYALIFDGRCLGHEGDPITIEDALGKKFDYAALMAGVA
jgi:hypothetical protein